MHQNEAFAVPSDPTSSSDKPVVGMPVDKPVSKTIEVEAENVAAVHPSEILPGRFARRARRQLSTQTSWPVEGGAGGGPLVQQIDRLTGLVDRLENKVSDSPLWTYEMDYIANS